MYKMCFEVTIGNVRLKGLESVLVESSIDQLSDRCTITLPGMVYNKAFDIESKIKRGDPVLVRLGYDDILRDEFKGYLRAIRPNSPMKLECEDAIYLFRKPIKDKHFQKTTATVIARYILDQINAQLPEDQKMKLITDATGFEFEKFTITAQNGYGALQTLKEQTGYAIYCRGRELHMHLIYSENRGNVTYDFARNIEESSDLEYVRAEDIRTRVKVVGRGKKGAKLEVEVGEEGGDVRTFQRPNISKKEALMKVAQQELKRVCYDGYKGSITGWLIPYCTIGYAAKVVDKDYEKRAGIYFVNAVKTSFSKDGGKRTVTLGVKLSDPKNPNVLLPANSGALLKSANIVDDPSIKDDSGDTHDEKEGVWV